MPTARLPVVKTWKLITYASGLSTILPFHMKNYLNRLGPKDSMIIG
jgi:hypothetical protein